jgi:hypothetical protein
MVLMVLLEYGAKRGRSKCVLVDSFAHDLARRKSEDYVILYEEGIDYFRRSLPVQRKYFRQCGTSSHTTIKQKAC